MRDPRVEIRCEKTVEAVRTLSQVCNELYPKGVPEGGLVLRLPRLLVEELLSQNSSDYQTQEISFTTEMESINGVTIVVNDR